MHLSLSSCEYQHDAGLHSYPAQALDQDEQALFMDCEPSGQEAMDGAGLAADFDQAQEAYLVAVEADEEQPAKAYGLAEKLEDEARLGFLDPRPQRTRTRSRSKMQAPRWTVNEPPPSDERPEQARTP